jgi:hypothetical protein
MSFTAAHSPNSTPCDNIKRICTHDEKRKEVRRAVPAISRQELQRVFKPSMQGHLNPRPQHDAVFKSI